jgi:hypothetical protein
VAEQVQGYLDKVEEEIRGKNDANLLELAKKLVLFNEDLGQPELLELFMKQTFPPALLQGGARCCARAFRPAQSSPTTRASTRGRRWCARVTCSASIARWS